MTSFFFDVTKTLEFGLQTGIQRVVRRIVTQAMALTVDSAITIVPVIAIGGRFHALTAAGLVALASHAQPASAHPLRTEPALRRRVRLMVARILPLYVHFLERQTDRRFLQEHAALFHPDPVDPSAGDVLVLIDLLFGGSPAVRAARRWRHTVRTVPVFYDMIAISHPEMTTPLIRYSFRRSLLSVTRWSTGVMTISRFCVAEIDRFLRRHGRAQPVAHFYLGNDLSNEAQRGKDALAGQDAIWNGDGAVFVMLGTVEPRKGHAVVLDAFDRLWASGSDVKLLIIGNIGWDMEGFVARCAAHPERHRRLFVAHGASDGQVADAMRRSQGSIVASLVEGFGLPVIESLAAGLPVIAADIPVFREVGGDKVVYFDRDSPDDLAAMLRDFVDQQARHRAMAAQFSWIDWEAATSAFLDTLATLLAASPRHVPHAGAGAG